MTEDSLRSELGKLVRQLVSECDGNDSIRVELRAHLGGLGDLVRRA